MKNVLTSALVAALVSLGLVSWLQPKPAHQLTVKEVLESPALVRELNDLRVSARYVESDLESLVHSDPKLTLSRIDRCIDASEKSEDLTGCGSFTDWVELELDEAHKAGASNSDINKRLDRIFTMAKGGKYYSGYLYTIDKEGPDTLKKYLDNVKTRINSGAFGR